MREETDDFTIDDYVSQRVGMLIEETMTFLPCHDQKFPRYVKMTHLFCHWEELYTHKNGDTLLLKKYSFGQDLCYHDIFDD